MTASHPAPNVNDENLAFHHRTPIQIRFNDVDRYGHVNNNAYFAFYDLGKESYLTKVLQTDYRANAIIPIVANINADFIKPIFYGDKIVVETRTAHIGQKSFTLQQRAVNTLTGDVVCQCSTVMVCFSTETGKSENIPENYRELLLSYELQ